MKKIKFFRWYRRHYEDRTQYFVLTTLNDHKKTLGDHNFGLSMYSKGDNIYKTFDYSLAAFSKNELEKGGTYTKAGNFEEFYDFEAHIPWIIFGQNAGRMVIESIFKRY